MPIEPTPDSPPVAAQPRVARSVIGQPQHRYPLPGPTQNVADLLATEIGKRIHVRSENGWTTVTIALHDDEAIWGFGQRFDAFDLRGRAFEIWAEDGWNRTDTSYFAIPWLISSAGYGLFVNSTGRLTVDIARENPDTVTITIPEEGVELWGFIGEPREVVAAYTALVGRPQPAPDWVFQPWLSRNSYLGATEINRVIELMETNEMKAGAVVLEAWEEQLHNFRFETNRYPNPAQWIRSLHERGYHVICWTTPSIWPLGSTYADAQRLGFLTKNADGSEHVTRWLENGREMDFRTVAAREFWRDLHLPLLELGVDGIKTDGGEHMPDPWFHNVHPFYYQRASLDAYAKLGKRGITFARSGNPLVAGNSTFWGGDQEAEWRNLAVVLRGGLSAALSGLFYWSHDVGGYSGTPTKELYIRWLQIGVFSPMMQLHGITAREPWTFDAETLRLARGYFKTREKLQPYLVDLAREAREDGHPMWRPLSWAFPADPDTHRIGDEFLLGDELLLAPILTEENRRSVYLPAGEWVDLWSGQTLRGPTRIEVTADLAVIPAYATAQTYARWERLFADVPREAPRPLFVALAGKKNERGIVPSLRYSRGNDHEELSYTIHNNTDAPVSGNALPVLPKGFQADPQQIAFTVPAKSETTVRFTVTVPPDLEPGSYDLTLKAHIGTRMAIAPPLTLVQPFAWKALGLLPGGVGVPHVQDGQKPNLQVTYPGIENKEIRWVDVPASALKEDGLIHLEEVLGNNGGTTSFLFAQFEVKTQRKAQLLLGSGDSMVVWLNQRRILERTAYRNPERDEDRVNILLPRGTNNLLIRISRNIGANSVYARMAELN